MDEIKNSKVDSEVKANLEKALRSALGKIRDNAKAMKVLNDFDGFKKDLGKNSVLATMFSVIVNDLPRSNKKERLADEKETLFAIGLSKEELAALEVNSFEQNPESWEGLGRTDAFKRRYFGRDQVEKTLV
jgi:hypothetical protein